MPSTNLPDLCVMYCKSWDIRSESPHTIFLKIFKVMVLGSIRVYPSLYSKVLYNNPYKFQITELRMVLCLDKPWGERYSEAVQKYLSIKIILSTSF